MSDIYDIDFAFQNKQLISPDKRKDKILDLTNAFTDSLQDLRDLVFDEYKTGSTASVYSAATAYVKYDRVIWEDMGVYELIVSASTGVDPTGEALSSTNWKKVFDYYLGSDERGAYNSQFIVLSYAINRWFGISASPYIYFINNNAAGLSHTIMFPVAVYTALGSSGANRLERLDQFIRKFTAAGFTYLVTTY